MRVIGFMPCHYGADYLKEALLSVIDLCEKFVIVYSSKPSYSHGTDAKCPDTEIELLDIALKVCGTKLIWHKHEFANEGEHRGHIYRYANHLKSDLILSIDSDEIFLTSELKVALETAYKGDKRYYGIGGYINFWKSFEWACYDSFVPIRITNLHNQSGEGVLPCTVYHFSCAQREEIMRYKLLVHGHKDEIRPRWLEDIYLKWTPENNFGNLHLVSYIPALWNATPFDKTTLPQILKDHPNYNKHLI